PEWSNGGGLGKGPSPGGPRVRIRFPRSAESAANFVFGRGAWKGPRRRQGTIPTVSTSSGTDGSNPAPSSAESIANLNFREVLWALARSDGDLALIEGRRRLAAERNSVIADNVDAHEWVLLIDPAAATAGDP